MTIYNANQLSSFTLEFSDREIYNDIRSECDISEILDVRPDATPELFTTFSQRVSIREPIPAASMVYDTFTAPSDYIDIVWLGIESYGGSIVTQMGWPQDKCEGYGGFWRYDSSLGTSLCMLPNSLVDMDLEVIDTTETSITVAITNLIPYVNWKIRAHYVVNYMALTPEDRYLKLRSYDSDSIAKYGRRVMNLTWPLGIAPNTMQSLIDSYCERYCEPVCLASMTLEGEIDTKIDQILNMRIDDKHEIIHPGLDMDEEFFVTSILGGFSRDRTGILTGTFGLEQIRDMEQLSYFIIGSSLIGGTDVIAP